MFPLIESIIGFTAIMLTLSFLVKSITSAIKNNFDFYSTNLKREVYSLLEGSLLLSRKEIEDKINGDENLKKKFPILASSWKRLGEEYFTKDNILWVLEQLGATGTISLSGREIEGRIKVHLANVRYMFEKRMKNITLTVGLALCMIFNINALKIWDKLYYDEDFRAKFASEEYLESIEKLQKEAKVIDDKYKSSESSEEQKEALIGQNAVVKKQLLHLQGQAELGIGKFWLASPDKLSEKITLLFYEFFGSLLTGILISIGAPYWHDLLRALGTLRKPKT